MTIGVRLGGFTRAPVPLREYKGPRTTNRPTHKELLRRVELGDFEIVSVCTDPHPNCPMRLNVETLVNSNAVDPLVR